MSTRSPMGSRSRRRRRSRSSSRPPTGCSSRARGSSRASGCSSGGSAAESRPRALPWRGGSARALGARRIVTSSSDAKLERARELGADVVVNHVTDDVKAAVKDATAGHGADVVVEHVGEATWRTSLDVAAREGRIAVCGATSGPNPPAALHRVWWKQLTILGSTMGRKADFEGAYELVASGRARPVVDEVVPLAEIRAAHARLEAGEQLGKIVLAIPGVG